MFKKAQNTLGTNVPKSTKHPRDNLRKGCEVMISKAYIMPHPPIIIPEIGRGKEKEAQKTIDGCRMAARKISAEKPETIIIISPHGPSYSNVVCIAGDPILRGNLGNFGCRKLSYEFRNDNELAAGIAEELEKRGIDVVVNNTEARNKYDIDQSIDHGALVPLYYVLGELKEFKLVHLATAIPGPMDLYKCGMAIKEAADESRKKVILIASSDLSHRLKSDGPYEYNPEGAKYDKFVVESIKEKTFADFLDVNRHMREGAGECGHRAISISLGVFEGRSCETEVFSYEGPFGVGYMTAAISDTGEGDSVLYHYGFLKENKMTAVRKQESPYVRLARETIEKYIRTGKTNEIKNTGGDRKGTFVSIKKDGRLRGCIGTIGPTRDSVEKEIIDNAIKAATQDPRFPPITEDELQDLIISVDVLFPSEKIDSRDMLDVKEYGVIVSKGLKGGLLLPNLDGIDTIDEQIDIALQKAGISPDEEYKMERFKVVRHE